MTAETVYRRIINMLLTDQPHPVIEKEIIRLITEHAEQATMYVWVNLIKQAKLKPSEIFKLLRLKRVFLEDDAPDNESVGEAFKRLYPNKTLECNTIWEDDCGYNFQSFGVVIIYIPDGSEIWELNLGEK